jgi:hypothetical protein
MPSIGKFGKPRPQAEQAEPDTFEWYGSDIRLQSGINQVRLINLMATARAVDSDSPAAAAIIRDLFEMVVQPDDFANFWQLAEDNWVDTEDLVELSQVLMEAVTNRPTQRRPDSSVGQPQTPVNSQAGSSSQVSSGPVEEPTTPHRPDLVLLQQGGRETRERLEQAARSAAVAG